MIMAIFGLIVAIFFWLLAIIGYFAVGVVVLQYADDFDFLNLNDKTEEYYPAMMSSNKNIVMFLICLLSNCVIKFIMKIEPCSGIWRIPLWIVTLLLWPITLLSILISWPLYTRLKKQHKIYLDSEKEKTQKEEV